MVVFTVFGGYLKFIHNPRDFFLHLMIQVSVNIQCGYVYHAEMKIGNQRFMFSDTIELEIYSGNSLFIVVTFDTKEEVQAIYNAFLPGST